MWISFYNRVGMKYNDIDEEICLLGDCFMRACGYRNNVIPDLYTLFCIKIILRYIPRSFLRRRDNQHLFGDFRRARICLGAFVFRGCIVFDSKEER